MLDCVGASDVDNAAMRRGPFASVLLLSAVLVAVVGCGDPGDETGAIDSGLDSGFDSALGDSGFGPDSRADTGDAVAEVVADSVSDTRADSGADSSADTTSDAAGDSITDSIADSAADSVLDAPDASVPYRHTIVLDGLNDFTLAAEKFATTSVGYDAFITWDATALYVGYAGTDIGSGASDKKWVFVYLDADPLAGTGASVGETYNTEHPKFPAGFGAEAYFALKTDGSFSQFKKYSAGSWSTVVVSGVTFSRNAVAGYVEMKIPLASIAPPAPTKLGVVTLMMNEAPTVEAAYAGLYAGSFTDGYATAVPVTYYLGADFASASSPNSAANRKP